MLQKLSDGAKGGFSKFILVGFLFMAVAGLVLTDVGGFFRDGISSTNVAEVGSEAVPYHEFDRFLRNDLSRRGISPQDAYQVGQINDILNRYTQDILFVQGAQKLGIRTPNEAVAQELHRFVRPYIDGNTTPQQALDQILRQQGLTEQNFITAIRRDLTSNVLKQALLSGVETSPSLLSEALMRFQNETRNITLLTLPNSNIKITTQPTQDELKELYEISKDEYRIPERRGLKISILDPETVVSVQEPTDAEIADYYEKNKQRYEVPAGKKIEQAVFSSEEEAKIFRESADGDHFKEKAAKNYRGESVFQKENAPEVLAPVIFSEDGSSVRGPVKTPLGWHVIHDLGNVDMSYRALEDVKSTISIFLKGEKKRNELFQIVDSINDKIDDEEPIDTLVDEYKMETLELAPIDQFGLTAENKNGLESFDSDKPLIIETLFDLYQDETSEMTELSDGRFAIIKTTSLSNESILPFEEVENKLKDRLIANRQRTENQAKAQKYLEQLQSGELSLAQIAEQNSLTRRTVNAVKRADTEGDGDATQQNISPNLKLRIFIEDPGKFVMTPEKDGFVLATSSNQKLDNTDDKEKMKDLSQQMAIVQTLSTYYDFLAKKIPVKVNQRLLDQLYAPPEG